MDAIQRPEQKLHWEIHQYVGRMLQPGSLGRQNEADVCEQAALACAGRHADIVARRQL